MSPSAFTHPPSISHLFATGPNNVVLIRPFELGECSCDEHNFRSPRIITDSNINASLRPSSPCGPPKRTSCKADHQRAWLSDTSVVDGWLMRETMEIVDLRRTNAHARRTADCAPSNPWVCTIRVHRHHPRPVAVLDGPLEFSPHYHASLPSSVFPA